MQRVRLAKKRKPVLLIHGGTGSLPDFKRLAQIRRSLKEISKKSYDCLCANTALEAVVSAVVMLEDDPLFNAGTGSMLQRDGKARMSSSVMDGRRLRFAGVLNIEQVKNPVLVAKALLDADERILCANGAVKFARLRGFPAHEVVTAERFRQWRKKSRSIYDTVGAVALDEGGNLAAATSTGGKGFEMVGRVSDSGMPVGTYANNQVAISCTGIGEEIIDEGLALRLAQRAADCFSIKRSFSLTFRELQKRKRRVGAIGLNANGDMSWHTTLPIFFAVMRLPNSRYLEAF